MSHPLRRHVPPHGPGAARSGAAPGPLAVRPVRPSGPARAALEGEVLLRAVIAGEAQAWRAFWLRYRSLVFAMAARTGTRAGVWLDADALADVVQETFLRLFEHDARRLRAYRPETGTSVSTWIGVVATTTTQDYLRRNRRHGAEVRDEGLVEAVLSTEPGPEARVLETERRLQAERALSSLSDRDQELLELLYLESISPEAAAARMGISVNTVYSKKAKLTGRLRGRLAES